MKKLQVVLILLATLGLAIPAVAAEFEFHGDMNHRFLLYTNQNGFFRPDVATDRTSPDPDDQADQARIFDKSVEDFYGEIKYRFWFDAATNDGNVKGTYAIEVGGIRFGETGQGGSYSGDDVNVETRWAFMDLQIPGVDTKAQFRLGLQPIGVVNEYLWKETAAGVIYSGAPNDALSYNLGWIRGVDELNRDPDSNFDDQDNWILRINFTPADTFDLGVFGLYQYGDAETNPSELLSQNWQVKRFAGDTDFSIFTVGVDGGISPGDLFVKWDLMYQGGDIKNVIFTDSFSGEGTNGPVDADLSAYFAHADVGYKFGPMKLTYTFWYASGDDDPTDDDFDAYLSTDVDRTDSITFFEGLYSDDNSYFTERPYIYDKGFIMNKLAFDHKLSEKFSYGAAGLYMLTAEDIEYFDAGGVGDAQSSNDLGFELNAFLKYMIYKNVEFALNAGYLFAGDAMDAFEEADIQDGSADENIFASSMRIRYKF